MRISDWSSDVCSSDLRCAVTFPAPRHQRDHDDENGDQRQLTSTQGTTPSAWAGRPPASWARVASARYQSRYDCTLATRACASAASVLRTSRMLDRPFL